MIAYFIVILAVLCLGVDLMILHQIRHRYASKKWARRVYLIHFLLFDAAIVTALMLHSRAVGSDSGAFMQTILWVIAIFFMNLIPKSVYLLISVFDYPLGRLLSRRVRWFSWSGLTAAALVLVAMILGATSGRNQIRVNEITITSERLPAAFEGYRIAQFTDLHTGNLSKHNRLMGRMVERINALDADLVVNTGDLVNLSSRELDERAMALLSNLRARDGVYSVLGNHDLGFYMAPNSLFTPRQSLDQLKEKQHKMGWRLLNNTSATLHRSGDSISLTGVNYPVSEHHNGRDTGLAGCDLAAAYQGVDSTLFNILLAHTPNTWEEALAVGGADLTLSGHVHAMQFKIKLGDWTFSPAEWMYKRWSGLYEDRGKYLYVNDGMGYVMYPMRIGTPPEITLFTLRRPTPPSSDPQHLPQ